MMGSAQKPGVAGGRQLLTGTSWAAGWVCRGPSVSAEPHTRSATRPEDSGCSGGQLVAQLPQGCGSHCDGGRDEMPQRENAISQAVDR